MACFSFRKRPPPLLALAALLESTASAGEAGNNSWASTLQVVPAVAASSDAVSLLPLAALLATYSANRIILHSLMSFLFSNAGSRTVLSK
jgi:hypothetical protein